MSDDCTCIDPDGLDENCQVHGEPALKREFDRGFCKAKEKIIDFLLRKGKRSLAEEISQRIRWME